MKKSAPSSIAIDDISEIDIHDRQHIRHGTEFFQTFVDFLSRFLGFPLFGLCDLLFEEDRSYPQLVTIDSIAADKELRWLLLNFECHGYLKFMRLEAKYCSLFTV